MEVPNFAPAGGVTAASIDAPPPDCGPKAAPALDAEGLWNCQPTQAAGTGGGLSLPSGNTMLLLLLLVGLGLVVWKWDWVTENVFSGKVFQSGSGGSGKRSRKERHDDDAD